MPLKKYITGHEIIIDRDSEHIFNDFSWFVNVHGYATGDRWVNKIKERCTLHHAIIGHPPRGKDVDHINRNKLDNRKCNLRFVTRSQNIANRDKRRDSKQKYKGIQLLPSGRYRAKGSGGKHLGVFDTPEAAYHCFLEYFKDTYRFEYVPSY